MNILCSYYKNNDMETKWRHKSDIRTPSSRHYDVKIVVFELAKKCKICADISKIILHVG